MDRHQLIYINIVLLVISIWGIKYFLPSLELSAEEKDNVEKLLKSNDQKNSEMMKTAKQSQEQMDITVDNFLNTINKKINDPMNDEPKEILEQNVSSVVELLKELQATTHAFTELIKTTSDSLSQQNHALGVSILDVEQNSPDSFGAYFNMWLEAFTNIITIYALIKCKRKLIHMVFIFPIFKISFTLLGLLVFRLYDIPWPAEALSRSFLDNVGFLTAIDHLTFVFFVDRYLNLPAVFCIPIFIVYYSSLYTCQKDMLNAEQESPVYYFGIPKRFRRKCHKTFQDRENRYKIKKQNGPDIEYVTTELNRMDSFVTFITDPPPRDNSVETREMQSGLIKESTRINHTRQKQIKDSNVSVAQTEQATLEPYTENQTNHFKILQRKLEAHPTQMFQASLYGHKEVVRSLLANHSAVIDITEKEEVTGFTAFHLACSGGHLSVVQQLMNVYGNEVCIQLLNRDLQTGLELAACWGRKDVVQTILNSIRKKYIRDNLYQEILRLSLVQSIEQGNHEIAQRIHDKFGDLKNKISEDPYFETYIERFFVICRQIENFKFAKTKREKKQQAIKMENKVIYREFICNILKTKKPTGETVPLNLEDFECPVCFEYMCSPLKIFACHNGHYICSICLSSPKIKTCPICRDDFNKRKPRRCLQAEEKAENCK